MRQRLWLFSVKRAAQIVCLTAYTAPWQAALMRIAICCLWDSVAMVVYGEDTTTQRLR